MIEIIHPSDRNHWLELRKRDVTASEIAAVLNVHPYVTPLELYHDKIGTPVDRLVTGAMDTGNEIETLAVKRIRAHYPAADVVHNDGPEVYYRNAELRIGCTPDCIVTDPERGRGVVEIKSSNEWTFKRLWLDEDEAIVPPLYATLQTLTQAMLVPGVTWAAIAVLRLNQPLKLDIVDVPLHAAAWQRLCVVVADFWSRVDARTPPDPDYHRDGRLIASLYPKDDDQELDLSHDNELVHAVGRRARVKEEIAELDGELDALDNMIRHKAGAATRVLAGDWIVTLKTETVKEHVRKASTRRPIRIKARTGAAA